MSFSFTLTSYDRVSSTNDIAREWAEAGAAEGCAVLAGEQSAGRGRRGRSWHSPRGNLYLSWIVRPGTPPAQAASLGFVAQMAAAAALWAATPQIGERLAYKWPNDLLCGGRKISGLLLESDGGGDWVVIGIGINLVDHPREALYPTTDLMSETGQKVAPHACAERLGEAFAPLYAEWRHNGFSGLRPAWRARAAGIGGAITVLRGEDTLRGIFEDIDEDGFLLVRTIDGIVHRIGAGDVFPMEKSDAARH
ncbi:MAG TPA: biotin--[acetyl-CoA-carboxylase] ligase [Dongiaceae bacterium]|jgi:BirA family biotin operon repressor/biotin-[acetyl-CoA-carboxylase] ligase|nr:biotin--[acetyl-CoA-carboxylase] ligase [Dongiaceae bacterium]